MTTDTNLSQIVFNRLSNEKYHELKTSGQLNDQQFYITPDLDTNPGLIQDYMSNCITKIPQHINLELNDGTLTLKAGSKVYIPNGANKFENVVVKGDINFTYTYAPSINTQCMLFINNTGTGFAHSRVVANCFSGTTQPSGNYKNWYNTTENKMYSIGNNATIDGSGFSFPIAIITQGSDGATKSIDQVFNGIGYIGAVAFALPGVQVIIPNGFNSNGQLNNYTATVERVLIKDYAADNILGHNLPLTLTNSPLLSAGVMIYVEEENQMYKDSIAELNKRTEVEIAKVTTNSTRITSLTPLPVYTRILNSAQVYDFGNDLLEKNITNCITKIPQDIKLELSTDGTLTLKAGSKVYVPNGLDGTTPKFDYITVETDVNINKYGTGNTDFFLCYDFANNSLLANANTNSGNTEITSEGFNYNTSTNKITFYGTTGNIVSQNVSFPIALCSRSSGTPTSIDQVFNGFGYIGSTIFALPGIEGLIPNGRNTNGSLNNTKFTTTNLLTYTYPSAVSNFLIGVNNINLASDKYVYNQNENYNRNPQGVVAPRAMFATVFTDSTGRITAFNPKTTFQTVDSNNALWASTASKPSNKSITYSLGASGSKYTISANGWFYFIIMSGKANAQATIINNTTGMQSRCLGNNDTGLTLITSLPVKAGDSITVNYTATGSAELKLFLDEGAL